MTGKVLFLGFDVPDYLADGMLHGLRSILGDRVIDVPRMDRLYRNCPPQTAARIRGGGFTLYRLLDDIVVDRSDIEPRIREGEFSLIIFSNIWYQYGLYTQLLPTIDGSNVAVLDGQDSPAIYPYAGRWWRRPELWLVPRAHSRFLYFKREWTPLTHHYRAFHLLPPALASRTVPLENLRTTAFSIPEEKIVDVLPEKTKQFPRHIVDPEVQNRVAGSSLAYAFADEQSYYSDLRESKFGITTRRAGWDCLRHYELAANGCVPCFRSLDEKPTTCAPHGLNVSNSIPYRGARELFEQIETIDDRTYQMLQANAVVWARANSTRVRAAELLRETGVWTGALDATLSGGAA